MKITDSLHQAVLQHSEKVAIKYGNFQYTYAQFWTHIEWYGTVFKQKIPKKYPVGVCMKNSENYLFAYYGLLLEGYLPMLIDHTFTQEELRVLRETYHIGSIVSLDDAMNLEIQLFEQEYTEFDPDQLIDVATCRFSSGTTGTPKCLMFTHEAILNAGCNWAVAASIQPHDRVLCTSLFHNGLAFNTSLLSVFLQGATLYINKQLTPKAMWKIVKEETISILVAFPVVYDMLNKSKFVNADHSLRLCISSAAPLHNSVLLAFEEKVQMPICDYYGIVEVGPCTFNNGSQEASVGKVISGVNIRVVDDEIDSEADSGQVGMIQIRSTSMARGYYRSSAYQESVTDDGYYRTADRGYLQDGYLYITGRSTDVINVAGKKVDPMEIENVLLKADGIREAAVFGVKNESQTSEYPVAFLVAEPFMEVKEVVDHCRKHLAPFKLPQQFVLVEAIPRSGVGKVKKQKLLSLLQGVGVQ